MVSVSFTAAGSGRGCARAFGGGRIMPAMTASGDDITYCGDAALGYAAARRHFGRGEALRFDDSYRVAHLPLIAPSHPAVLRSATGTDYQDGRYTAARYALVVP